MQLLGREAYGKMAEEQLALTERFVTELTKDRKWEEVTPVDTCIAAVRYKGASDEFQDKIVDRVLAGRKLWISPTTTVGVRAIRVMVISYLTEWRHLEELIAALRKAAAEG